MKKVVIVKRSFVDKYDRSLVYKAGAAVAFDEPRAASVVFLGLADYAPEPKPQPAPAKDEPKAELPKEETAAAAKKPSKKKK